MVWIYFRFRSAQKATTPTNALMTTAMIAISVVPNANAAGSSASIVVEAVGAGSTVKYVEADDLP